MIPIKHPPYWTFSTFVVLGILALSGGALVLIPSSNDAVRPVAFALLALLMAGSTALRSACSEEGEGGEARMGDHD